MNLPNLIRKPLVAAVAGALFAGAPLGAFYVAESAHAAPAATVPTAPVPAAANPAAQLPDFSTMVQRYGPAVVNITVVSRGTPAVNSGDDSGDDDNGNGNDQNPFGPNSPFAPFFRGLPFQAPPQGPVRGEGSGFIIRNDGVIMTNAHVVNGASEVTVRMTDRREYTAKVIGVDTKSDIAVIKIAAKDLPTVKLGDSKGLKVGEWVLAIGAPFGFENSATAGIVSAKGRTLDTGYVPFIQTDVPINPGNSGGPLFNMRGEVVGINSQIYSRSGGYQGVSFSIPIDVALQVSQQLQTSGHVTRGKIGVTIQPVTQGLADSFGLPQPEGALVSSVEKGGPGERAGIEPGDVILKLNGQPLNDSGELPVLVAAIAPGTSVNLEVWRNHAARNVSVTLGALEDKRTAANLTGPQSGGKLGLSVRPLSPDEQRQGNLKSGLVVERSAGPAAAAGIQPGDVVIAANGTNVTSAEDLKSAVEKSKGHIALLIQRGEARIFVPVRVG
ncbi:MAG: DegQ family serine endoprotease [Gammaproteobacteria bacterium]|nr:DegQ family serine endoprotease [Gammaproteobacteria bacterium]MBV9695337.1 DegQ family serine endoprotease [Gammaproteobacteria bacterium]